MAEYLQEQTINWTSHEFYDAYQGLVQLCSRVHNKFPVMVQVIVPGIGAMNTNWLKHEITQKRHVYWFLKDPMVTSIFPSIQKNGTLSNQEWIRLRPMILLTIDAVERHFGGHVES